MPRKSAPAPEPTDVEKTSITTSSQVIHVRLDSETVAALDSYMTVMNMNRSQAVRTLIFTGARAGAEHPEAALRAASVREGMILGLREIKKRTEEMFRRVLLGMEDVG